MSVQLEPVKDEFSCSKQSTIITSEIDNAHSPSLTNIFFG